MITTRRAELLRTLREFPAGKSTLSEEIRDAHILCDLAGALDEAPAPTWPEVRKAVNLATFPMFGDTELEELTDRLYDELTRCGCGEEDCDICAMCTASEMEAA